MTGDVAEALAAMLQQQPHLRALNLNDTSLEDAGVSTVAQALASSGILHLSEGSLVCVHPDKHLPSPCVSDSQTARRS